VLQLLPQVWKKQEAQLIVPCLWLGPYHVARDEAYLKNLGVTTVIVVRSPDEAPFLKPKFLSTFHYHIYEIVGNDVRNVLNDSVRAITKAISDGQQVLVHGNAGIGRSACVVCAYIMSAFRVRLEAAIYYVGTRRHSVAIDDNLKKQLSDFEAMYLRVKCEDSQVTVPVRNGTAGVCSQENITNDVLVSETEHGGGRSHVAARMREVGGARPSPAMVVKGTAPRELNDMAK